MAGKETYKIIAVVRDAPLLAGQDTGDHGGSLVLEWTVVKVSAEYLRQYNPQPGGFFVERADGTGGYTEGEGCA